MVFTDTDLYTTDFSGQTVKKVEKDALVILVDGCMEMFTESSKDSTFDFVMKICIEIVKDKIISSRSDLLSIIIYNSRCSNNKYNFDKLSVIHELGQPSIDCVKKLKSIVNIQSDFRKMYIPGIKDSSSYYEVLSFAQMTLNQGHAGKFKNRRVFIFSPNDCPNEKSKIIQSQSKIKIEDMRSLGIAIELFPLSITNKFELKNFYQEAGISSEELDLTKNLNILREAVKKKEFKKQKFASCVLRISDTLDIAVDLFCLISQVKRDVPIYLKSETNEILTGISRYRNTETGELIKTEDLANYYPLGNQKIVIENDNFKKFRQFEDPSVIFLIGFLPKSSFKIEHNIRAPWFMHYSERTGSSCSLFTALLTSTLKQDKLALCRTYIKRLNVPRFISLLPIKSPPGFTVSFVPYEDEIRYLNLNSTEFKKDAETQNSLDSLTDKITEKLTVKDFNPILFDNPSNSKFYRVLEAYALEENIDTDMLDLDETIPDKEEMRKKCPEMSSFSNIINSFPLNDNSDTDCYRIKRKPSTNLLIRKKQKKTINELTEELRRKTREKSLNECTVDDLKVFLRFVGGGRSGRKLELMQKVEEYFSRK